MVSRGRVTAEDRGERLDRAGATRGARDRGTQGRRLHGKGGRRKRFVPCETKPTARRGGLAHKRLCRKRMRPTRRAGGTRRARQVKPKSQRAGIRGQGVRGQWSDGRGRRGGVPCPSRFARLNSAL